LLALPTIVHLHESDYGREDFWFIVAIRGAKMSQKSGSVKEPAEKVVKDIRRATRKRHSPEEKIRIVLSGLRGEESIAELCRREVDYMLMPDASIMGGPLGGGTRFSP